MRIDLLSSNIVCLLILIFLSLFVHNFRPFLTQICINDVITGDKVLKKIYNQPHKHFPHLNVSLTIGFDLISPIVLDIYNFGPLLTQFQNNIDNIKLLKNWFKNEWLTLKKTQLLNLIFLSQLEYSLQIWPLLAQFWLYESQGLLNFQILEE